VQLADKMIDLSASGHAVLSQNFAEHFQDLTVCDWTAFDKGA
jgi:hypothetical protein